MYKVQYSMWCFRKEALFDRDLSLIIVLQSICLRVLVSFNLCIPGLSDCPLMIPSYPSSYWLLSAFRPNNKLRNWSSCYPLKLRYSSFPNSVGIVPWFSVPDIFSPTSFVQHRAESQSFYFKRLWSNKRMRLIKMYSTLSQCQWILATECPVTLRFH